MAQFDVYRIKGHGLVIDCQSNLLGDLKSRLVAPLRDAKEAWAGPDRLNPRFEIDGQELRMATQFLRAVERAHLSDKVASLADHDLTIKSAIDSLISGF
jgi:toxin CcdB